MIQLSLIFYTFRFLDFSPMDIESLNDASTFQLKLQQSTGLSIQDQLTHDEETLRQALVCVCVVYYSFTFHHNVLAYSLPSLPFT